MAEKTLTAKSIVLTEIIEDIGEDSEISSDSTTSVKHVIPLGGDERFITVDLDRNQVYAPGKEDLGMAYEIIEFYEMESGEKLGLVREYWEY